GSLLAGFCECGVVAPVLSLFPYTTLFRSERFIDPVHSSIGGLEACDRRGESEIQNPEADEAHVSEAHEPSPPGRVASEPVGAVEEEALRCACEQAREDRRPTERVEEIAHASCLLREARREAAIL